MTEDEDTLNQTARSHKSSKSVGKKKTKKSLKEGFGTAQKKKTDQSAFKDFANDNVEGMSSTTKS